MFISRTIIQKRTNMKTKATIFSLIVALTFAALIGGCSPGPVEIEEVVTCKNLDSEYKPLDITTTFPSGTEVVYIAVKIKNMTTEDRVTTTWNYLETKEQINTTDFTTEERGSGYIGFSLQIDNSFPAGRYNAIVYLNNEEAKTVEFSVE